MANTFTLTDPTGKKTMITAEQAQSYNQGQNTLAKGFSVSENAPAPAPTQLKNPVPATNLQPATPVQLPEQTAPEAQMQTADSLNANLQTARTTLENTYATQKAEVDTKVAELEKQQAETLAKAKPLTEPFRQELETTQRKKLQVEDNFMANQKLTNELDTLLQEQNAIYNRAKGIPMNQRAQAIRTGRALQDIQARAGVIEAVINARNNQISVAENMIDRSISAIVADRTDSLNYYNTVLDLNNNKLLTLSADSKALAEKQVGLLESDLQNAQATSDYIKGLMIDPDTASFMADAGVTLTDSVEQIQFKMAKQSVIQERSNTKNSLVEQGYQYSPVPISGPDVVTFDVGGETMYFRIPQEVMLDRELKRAQIASANRANQPSGTEGMSWSERANVLKLAEMGDPMAIQALGYDPEATPTKEAAKQAARDSALKELDKINGIVDNTLGISSSAGTIQSPMLAQMLGVGAAGAATGAGTGLLGGPFAPVTVSGGAVAGGVVGAITGAFTGSDAKRKKENFLGEIDFLMSGDSFDKFRELKAAGVTFGATTEREWDAVRKAANELEALAKRDKDGKLVGFTGTEDKLEELLLDYQAKTQTFANSFIDESNATSVVGDETMTEINKALGVNTNSFSPASYY